MNRLLDLIANRENCAHAIAAEPEVPVIEEKIHAVLFGLDRVVERTRTHDGEPSHTHLEAAGRARLGAHFARDVDRRLERQVLEPFPHFVG
ncbi:MAG TPA: hypothetical protein VGM50_11355 [Gemmatimonadaceae bacterium]